MMNNKTKTFGVSIHTETAETIEFCYVSLYSLQKRAEVEIKNIMYEVQNIRRCGTDVDIKDMVLTSWEDGDTVSVELHYTLLYIDCIEERCSVLFIGNNKDYELKIIETKKKFIF